MRLQTVGNNSKDVGHESREENRKKFYLKFINMCWSIFSYRSAVFLKVRKKIVEYACHEH